jgi:hypothetical protein
VSDTSAGSPSSSLSLGVWIGICIGCSVLSAVIVGVITFFLASRRVDYSNRV